MTISWNERPLEGCLFEASPAAAPTIAATAESSLPERVDLRELCSPVEDQGLTNSCTANAIVGALEYLQRRAGQTVTDLSRLFVYYNARQLGGTADKDCGSLIHHVMASVMAHGACEERMWPFEKAMTLVKPTEAAYANALSYQAVQYGRTPLGEPAMAALAAGIPVVFGTYVPRGFYDVAARTGVMPGPGPALEVPGGGHAMLLVGYDAKARQWIVRNSWGPSYAERGYLRIPFETLAVYSRPDQFWSIGAIDQARGLKLCAEAGAAPVAHAPVPVELGGSTLRAAELKAGFRSELEQRLASTKDDIRRRLRGDA